MKTIPDIIDNTEHKLSDVLNYLINENSSVYIATGYFNIAGFNLVKDKLKIAKEVKILIGRALSPEHVIKPDEIESKLKEEIEDELDDEKNVNLLNDFIEFLNRENVEIKIFKNNSFHGKFYIVDGGIPVIGSIAIVGSSNLTYAGLTCNTELNSIIKQEEPIKVYKQKFLKMFNENADDYKPYLLSLLSGFTSQYKPYDIYIKILYSYFEGKLSESPTEEMPSPIILADFQKDGYLSALQSLEKYGGVILADSVGLGKTYLALRILDDFAYRLRQKALIICPAQIKNIIWEPKLREFRIKADIVTQERVSRDFKIDEYKDYDLIIIDESHNFRNSSTKRWKNLFQMIINGNKNKKVVLITATPINNTVFDLYHQLRFITKDQDHFFVSAGISSLWGYFLKAHFDKEALYDLLEEIAVRRSRPFIKKYYPDALIDGKPLKFPERELHTVRYKLTNVYSEIYEECIEAIESLTLASYNVEIFRKELFSEQYREFEKIKSHLESLGWNKDKIRKSLMDIGRNEAVIGILKILLLKRLESSIFAFKESIKNLLDFQRKFLEALNLGKFLDKESYRKFLLSQSSDEETEDYFEILNDIDPDEYEIEEIRIRTEKDIHTLEEIYDKLSLSPDEDDKLQQLVKTLQELKNKKVVIFGYFKDTIRYIYNYITQDEVLKNLGLRKECVEIIDSDVEPEKRKNIIISFSPVSNGYPDIKGTEREIQILFSTDVLSEGQNLQDADVVINYDLPWNPVRIIQRVGRLDRIGSPHDIIHVYNFFPEDELESIIKLLERLYKKLDAINKSVGLDSSVLGETPNPRDFGYIKSIFEEDKAVLDELEELSEIAIGEFMKDEVLKYIKSIGHQKVAKIPNGVGSGIKRPDRKGVFVAFKDKERHYWCFYDANNNKIIENKLECIKIIKCSEDEPFVPPTDDINIYQIIRKVKHQIISRLKTSKVKPQKLETPQNSIVNFLQSVGNKAKGLLDYYSNPLPEIYLKELKKLWSVLRNVDENTILKNLEEFKNNHQFVPEQQKESQEDEIKLKLVAFMTVSP